VLVYFKVLLDRMELLEQTKQQALQHSYLVEQVPIQQQLLQEIMGIASLVAPVIFKQPQLLLVLVDQTSIRHQELAVWDVEAVEIRLPTLHLVMGAPAWS